jgi:uncharacterized protein YndB with AHSA1/START domain
MHIELDQRLRIPVEQAFAFIADPRHRPEWQSSLDAVEMLSEGPPHVGMRWRERPAPGLTFEMELTELEPNRRWAERGRASIGTVDVAVDFQPENGDTHLHVTIDLRLHWLAKPLGLGARWLLPSAMRADLKRVEERAGSLFGPGHASSGA